MATEGGFNLRYDIIGNRFKSFSVLELKPKILFLYIVGISGLESVDFNNDMSAPSYMYSAMSAFLAAVRTPTSPW